MFRQITRYNPAILSITFLHGEDMQPFDAHVKKCVGMIVQMDAVGHKKAGGNSLTPSASNGSVERSYDAQATRAPYRRRDEPVCFPKIKSERNGGAAQTRLGWLQRPLSLSETYALKYWWCSPVCAENLDSDVLVMQPANQGIRHNASDPLNWARDRRILGQ